jgi:hypothetical protein
METHIKLSTFQSPATTAEFAQMCDVPYHTAVRLLMYASLGTCPDISFAIQTLSHFSTNQSCSLESCQMCIPIFEGYDGPLAVVWTEED